ncbi:MAG: hypothetical protein BEN18_11390 [Epulopiscium sp. Nuni2H_MBin001]|nr:MAG: hypothetical protein BEN18_11390 [Epulopiscium sp. Nuni2H_MBin001]
MTIQKHAKNIEEAIKAALEELDVTQDMVDIEIIDKGFKGFLNIGTRNATIQVKLKDENKINDPIVPTQSMPVDTTELDAEKKVQNFLEDLTSKMGITCSITTKKVDNRLKIDIAGDKLGIIIGKRGEILDSIQYLTQIIANKNNSSYIKVILDIGDYRAKRNETLSVLANKMANKAVEKNRAVALEPMNSYDRRIIHEALHENELVNTSSEGKEPYRKVIITLK